MEIVFEFVNDYLILPIVLITFLLLSYIEYYLIKQNPDVIKARIFLRYNTFKKAFLLLILFSIVLLLHTALIYYPHMFYFIFQCTNSFIHEVQRILGLFLVLILIYFVVLIYKTIR